MYDKWIFEPYKGVGPIKFGMSIKEVEKILGAPSKTLNTPGRKLREFRGGIIITYSHDTQTVDEISCTHGEMIFFHDKNLLQDDVVSYLEKYDNEPYKAIGGIIFFKLGVAISGYHNGDESQKNVIFFKQGIWDRFKTKLSPYRG